MRVVIRLTVATAITGTLLALASPAMAQTGRVAGSTWRQRDRTDALRSAEGSSQNFAFELRFGPYSPEVDESPNANGAYKAFFGSGAQFYFGLEFDYLPVRIPYVGVVGAGFGWGYTMTSAKAKLKNPSATGAETDEETRLSIMPMHLSAVLRADELMRRTGVPVVPYIKLGYGLGWWRTSDGMGTSVRTGSDGSALTDDVSQGLGTTSGYHLALGAMLCLNFLDERAIANLDQNVGVNHVYAFAEWMNARLVGPSSKSEMHIGTSTVVAGLAIDM